MSEIKTDIQTVTFHDGEAPREVSLLSPSVDNSSTQQTRKEGRDHSIEDVLGRPILVKTGTWSVTDARGTILNGVDFPGIIWATSPNAKAKASGFLSLKATACFKVALNGQKAQQGRLCVSYAPTAAVLRKGQLETNLMTFTQRPRTDIDVSSDTDVTIRIPYISEYLGVNFAKGNGGMGYFDLWVYSPLVSPTGSTVVGYSIYAWLEDIDLEYPTYVAQGDPPPPASIGEYNARMLAGVNHPSVLLPAGYSAMIVKKADVNYWTQLCALIEKSSIDKKFIFNFVENYSKASTAIMSNPSGDYIKAELSQLIYKCTSRSKLAACKEILEKDGSVVYTAEAGIMTTKRGDPATSEAKNPGTGINGSSSPMIRTIMSAIPTLASVAGIPPWATAVAKGVAQAFGFSKPIADHMLAKVVNSPFPHLNHADGASYAHNMGLFHKNTIQHMPGFAGQDVDEMSFAYIACIPSFYKNAAWNKGHTTGHWLFEIPVRPQEFRTTVDGWTYHTPMSYISNVFDLWRTSFMFHIKVVKTQFHSGRLKVAWRPGATEISDSPDFNYLYQEIFDLRDGTEFTFNVPYIATTPYLSQDEIMGMIYVVVQNPLVSPDIVASSVDIIVEVCAGKDVEFAVPIKPRETPISYGSVQMQALARTTFEDTLVNEEEIYEAKPVDEEVIYEAEGDEWGEVAQTIIPELQDTVFKIYGEVDFVTFQECVHELLAAKEEKVDPYLSLCVRILSRHAKLDKLNRGWGDAMTYDHETNTFTTEYTLFEWIKCYILEHKKSVRQGCTELSNRGLGMPRFVKRGTSTSPKRSKSKTPSPPRTPKLLEPEVVYEAQGLMDNCESGNSATVNMSEDPVAPDSMSFDVSNPAHCIGESCGSWRVYAKRAMPWKKLPTLGTGATFRFRTGMFHQATTTGNSLVQLPVSIDALNYIAPCYVFWRGSVRYLWYGGNNSSTNTSVRFGLNKRDSQMGANEFQTLASSERFQSYNQVDNIAYAHQISGGGLEVQVPFYCKRTTATVDINLPGNPAPLNGNPDLVMSVRAPGSTDSVLMRAAGDDFDLGFFLGAPITKPTFTIAATNTEWEW